MYIYHIWPSGVPPPQPQERVKQMKKKRASMFTVLILLLLCAYMVWTLVGLYGQITALEASNDARRQQNRLLSQRNDALSYAVENSGEDEVIAQAARQELGLVYPDETVYTTDGR